MRRLLTAIVLMAMGFASTAQEVAAQGTVEVEQFAVSGIKADATAQSPRQARDLAMAQARPLAWRKLFRRLTRQRDWATEPQLPDSELLGLILRADALNERRSTTRYLAEVTFHFNPAAVRQLLFKHSIALAEEPVKTAGELDQALDRQASETKDATTHLAVTVRLNSVQDWATLRARLPAADGVTGMQVIGRTLNEAQIYLSFSGDVDQLQDALAQQSLELTSSDGQYTLELGDVSGAQTAALQ